MTSRNNPMDFDIRTRERNLRTGVVSSKDLERYLKELPDVAENAEPVSLTQPIFEEETDGATEAAPEGAE